MTIKNPETFKRMPPAKFDGVFDWDFLKPAFAGTKIEPTDIDAVVERLGNFLVFETKNPDKGLEQGQIIMLENLLRLGRGRIHLMIIYGKAADEIVAMEEWYYKKGQIIKHSNPDCDSDYVLRRTTKWFSWANNGKHN